jgi:predicted metal-dependent HD superfamily phosphohydrolase
MNISGEEWRRLWTALGAQSVNGGLFNQLVRAYGEPQRHYHTLQHLRECLAHCEAAAALARRPEEVELALWFHDAVYDPRRQDNEQRSADWARSSVLAAGCDAAIAERVAGLVLLTAGHEAPADDPDAQLLLDVDLAILGAAPARFVEYERQIRAEYAHVPQAPAARASWPASRRARACIPPSPSMTRWKHGPATTSDARWPPCRPDPTPAVPRVVQLTRGALLR